MSANGFYGPSAHARDTYTAVGLFADMPSADSIFATIKGTATHYGDLFSGAVGAGLRSVADVFGIGSENPGTSGYTRSIGGTLAPGDTAPNVGEQNATGDDETPTSGFLQSGSFLLVAGALAAFLIARRF